AFRLEPDINNDMLVRNLENGSGNDNLFGSQILSGGGISGLLAVKICQRSRKIGCIVVQVIIGRLVGCGGNGRNLARLSILASSFVDILMLLGWGGFRRQIGVIR